MNIRLVSGAFLATLTFCACAHSAVISGHVTTGNHQPVGLVFIGAHLEGGDITYYVQANSSGFFVLPKLPRGTYIVGARTPGMEVDRELPIDLRRDSSRTVLLKMHQRPVMWKDLSIADWRGIFPESNGKQDFERHCFTCHGYQKEIADKYRDQIAWDAEMKRKRTDMAFWLGRMNDDAASSILAFLNRESVRLTLPLSHAERAHYQVLRASRKTLSTGVVFVEYDITIPGGSAWSAIPDRSGNVWIPLYGHGNGVARLRIQDGTVKIFPVGDGPVSGIHSVSQAADGSIWLTEFNHNRIAYLNPYTGRVEEFQDSPGGSTSDNRNSVQIDRLGVGWSTGSPFASFDVRTKKFTDFPDVPKTYGLGIAENGDVWFTAVLNSSIGMVDHENGQLRQWKLPHTGTPQHIEADGNRGVYFTETAGGKIIRFDPSTQHFHDFQLPGPSPSPYALVIDHQHRVWYSSTNQDTIGCLNPETSEVQEYEFPHSEAFLRELKMDNAGRIWYSSPSNHVVGYFYVPDRTSPLQAKNTSNGVHL